jgi:hypothetical protein
MKIIVGALLCSALLLAILWPPAAQPPLAYAHTDLRSSSLLTRLADVAAVVHGAASYSVAAYDPVMFPTAREARTAGPLGYWKRLPMPSLKLGPDGPPEWWPKLQEGHYLKHNILNETSSDDPSFNRGAIQTESMLRWRNQLSNRQRREAIMQCAVAFEQFLNATLPDAEWWLEGGSLVGAIRKPHKFIPWDSDADVTLMEDSWQKVVGLLKQEKHDDPQPNTGGAPCGCLLVDTESFGSRRPGYRGVEGKYYNQIPGRVINECTGNYVDLFTAVSTDGGQKLVLSQQPWWLGPPPYAVHWSWDRADVLPPQRCDFDGFPFKCPADPWKYLDGYSYGPTASKPDHVWDSEHLTYSKCKS